MKIDVTTVLTEFDGTELTTQMTGIDFCEECAKKWNEARKPLTMRLVCTRALTLITQETQALDGQEKFERAELARKIYKNDTVSLKPTEVVTLMDVIGKVQGPLVVLQVYDMLDPKDK